MNDHLFNPSGESGLYDTRVSNWHKLPPLRPVFKWHYREINTPAQFKATLRAGKVAWPGLYPLYLLCSDGDTMCFDCGKSELRQILPAIRDNDRSGWRVIGCDANWEDEEMVCCHCNKPISSAYGEQ